MTLAIMQPYFMPYLGYFQAIAAVDKYILYDNLTYILSGWINKNRIRQRNNPPSWIIVPLKQKSSYTLIADTQIDNSKPWKKKILTSIRLAYAKADYFEEVMPLLEDIFAADYDTISELNCQSIIKICKFLDLKTEVVADREPYLDIEKGLKLVEDGDYSAFPYMTQTHPIKKVARPIAICKLEGSDHFVNAIGGTELYSKEEFAQYGIKLNFIQMHEIKYPQKCNDGSYEPYMSIIDVLMHNGKEKTKQLLTEYTLV